MLNNRHLGIILLISHILSSLLVGYCFRFWKKNKLDINYRESKFNSSQTPIKISELGEILGNSIKKAIGNILSIGGFIVLFSVILSILNSSGFLDIITSFLYEIGISKELSLSIITGIIELTNGLNLSTALYQNIPLASILISSFLLGFGGISVLLQVYSIICKENISIKPYFYGKLLQGFFSIIFTFILI